MTELREQLRKRELLEIELEFQKNMVSVVFYNDCHFLKILQNAENDQQIQNLYKENLLLRQQKESLMNLLRQVICNLLIIDKAFFGSGDRY